MTTVSILEGSNHFVSDSTQSMVFDFLLSYFKYLNKPLSEFKTLKQMVSSIKTRTFFSLKTTKFNKITFEDDL